MRIVTGEVMRELDRMAMSQCGVPGSVLMENAGRAVTAAAYARFGRLYGLRARIECGGGNNGGDGFVAARLLHLGGARVSLGLAMPESSLKGDAAAHYRILREIGVAPEERAGEFDLQIDALLGTGARGAPRGRIGDAIGRLNSSAAFTLAVDIPSGLDADSGAAPGAAVQADATVTFAYPKLGMFLPPGADLVGELTVSDIGFAWDRLPVKSPYCWLRPIDLMDLMPARPRESHKGRFGHVLVVGGSRGMSGAPVLAARAALRSGAGLVTIAAPVSAQPAVASSLPEAMTLAAPEENGAFSAAACDAILHEAMRCQAVCIGPGMTTQPGALETVFRLLEACGCPIVLDADGLSALAARPSALENRRAPTVLTPHPGECARLLGSDTAAVQADRVGSARAIGARFRAVVVLKGARTLVVDGRPGTDDLPVSINTTGNPGMATAGMGDTLTGVVGSLIGQGIDAYAAACLAVYLHGVAGDLAAAEIGTTGLIAGDVAERIPRAMDGLRCARASAAVTEKEPIP